MMRISALCCLAASAYAAQNHDVVCNDGDGSFQAEFRTGVAVQVRAARNGKLATRACEAILTWKKEELIVETNASQIDLDSFGIDLGLGVPVTTFQLKKSRDECCVEYRVYSLEMPPRLLLTMTGGDFFTSADTDLDGRLEIWTHDAAAVDGFERLSLAELDSAPTIVLRLAHGELLDVSAEFQSSFDHEIARLRKEIDSDSLRDFKNSDGKLSPDAPLSAERLHQLRGVKAKILEIVWNYLYSNREPQAWHELAEMWPPSDVARIRAAILNAHAHGISSQTTGVSEVGHDKPQKRVHIFDAIGQSAPGHLEVTPPTPIFLRVPPAWGTPSKDPLPSEMLLELVIDSAGKVRSAEPAGKAQPMDAMLMNAANGWKFVPAFKGSRAVASRIRLASSPRK